MTGRPGMLRYLLAEAIERASEWTVARLVGESSLQTMHRLERERLERAAQQDFVSSLVPLGPEDVAQLDAERAAMVAAPVDDQFANVVIEPEEPLVGSSEWRAKNRHVVGG